MPLVRAICPQSLVPVRNLLEHRQAARPNEPKQSPVFRSYGIFGNAVFYEFYGRQISPSTTLLHRREFDYLHGLDAPQSEIALAALEQAVGKDVYWDKPNDRIVAITREGIMLSLRGTNLVEAAVALPLMYDEVLKHSPGAEKGISIVEAAVVNPREYLSRAASPLQVKLTIPNLNNFDPTLYGEAVKHGFQLALANRL